MSNCQITIKIKDFLPKIDTLSYNNYKCLISIGNNISEIYLSNYLQQFFHHQPKLINTDLIYKIKLIDCVTNSLIGGKELIIPYEVITRISHVHPIIYNVQLQLIIDAKTKRKIFGTLITNETIILSLVIEINLIPQNINNINIKKKRIINKSKSIEEIKNNSHIKIKKNKNQLKNNTIIKYKSSKILNNKNNNSNKNVKNKNEINKSKNFKLKNNKNLSINIFSYENNPKNTNSQNTNYITTPNFKNDCLKKMNTIINTTPNNNNYKNNKVNINTNKDDFIYIKNKQNERKNKSINNNKKNNNFKKILNNKKVAIGLKKGEKKKFKIHEKLFVKKSSKRNKKCKSLTNIIIDRNKHNHNHIYRPNNSLQKYNTSSSVMLNNIKRNENIFNEDYFYRKGQTPKNVSRDNNIFFNSYEIYMQNKNNIFFDSIESKSIQSKANNIFDKKNISQLKLINNFSNNLTKVNINNNHKGNHTNYTNVDTKENNNIFNIINFNINKILCNKILVLSNKNKDLIKKNIIYKEKYLNEIKKNNIIKAKNIKNNFNIFSFKLKSALNKNLLFNLVYIKKIENNILQNIFNINNNIFNNFYENNNFIIKNEKISLLLILVKNFIKKYGKISNIYDNNLGKKIKLQNLLNKYGIKEDKYYIKDIYNNINNQNYAIYDKKSSYISKYNKDIIKIIKEEDGEEEDDVKTELFNKKYKNNLNKSINKNKNKKNQKKNSNNNKPKFKFTKKKKMKISKNYNNTNNHFVFNNIIINNNNK